MNKKNDNTETTNLDIIENLDEKLNQNSKTKNNSKTKKEKKHDEFAVLEEDYLDYSK